MIVCPTYELCKHYTEETSNPRRDSEKAGRCCVMTSLICMFALFSRSLFLDLESFLGNSWTLLLFKHLPRNPAAESPILPLIWCSTSSFSQRFSPEMCFFADTGMSFLVLLPSMRVSRKNKFVHNHPKGVVYRSLCLNYRTVAVSEMASRRWWCTKLYSQYQILRQHGRTKYNIYIYIYIYTHRHTYTYTYMYTYTYTYTFSNNNNDNNIQYNIMYYIICTHVNIVALWV